MSHFHNQWMKIYVHNFFDENYFYTVITKQCKKYGFLISKAMMGNIISKKDTESQKHD